jgi:hypothetical protein
MAAMRTKLPTAALVLRSAYNAKRPRLTPQGVVGEIKGQNVAKANADFGFLPEMMWIGSPSEKMGNRHCDPMKEARA